MAHKDPEKSRAYQKAYREANKDKIRAQRKAYYEANADKEKARKKIWREANADKAKAGQKAYREANKDKEKARHEAYREANADKIKAQGKAYREANKGKIKARNKAWRGANRETHLACLKTWRQNNKEARTALEVKRNASKKQAILPSSDLKLIKKLYEQRAEMSKKHGEQYHVDHIIPLSIGGAHHQDNMRVITAKENLEKNDKYAPELGGVWADNDLARETKKKLGIK